MFDFAINKRHANRFSLIVKRMAALTPTLLLSLLFTSCMTDGNHMDDNIAGKSDTYINLNVSTPTAQARANSSTNSSASLGQDETSPSPEEEEKIYSIRVWAFKTGSTKDATPIGFKSETGLNEKGSHRISMKILRKYAENLQNIDLYILLNAESIGVLNGSDCNTMTRQQLEEAVISNTTSSNFGIQDGAAQTTTVPTEGLPISRIVTNINVADKISDSETAAAANPVSIPLVRAVSKLHFFFARKDAKDTQDVEITKIEVNENVLSTTSSVFPTATTDEKKSTEGLTGNFDGMSYLHEKWAFGGIATADINVVGNPTEYSRQSAETAQAYMTRLSQAVKESYRSYQRETNQPISGKIYYKTSKSGAEKSMDFEVKNAYRNHELVVYGYFSGESQVDITLNYYVASWNEKDATNITFD